MILYGGSTPDPVSATPTEFASQIGQFPAGEGSLSAFSFAIAAAKEKAIKKKTPMRDFALCGARQGLLALDRASLPKGLSETLMKKVRENFNVGAKAKCFYEKCPSHRRAFWFQA